jgi:lactate dehydrogenase-like 2-hydroxyacid dehydrogenase
MSLSDIKIVRLEPMPAWTAERMATEFDTLHLETLDQRPPALLEKAGQFRALATPGNVGADRALLELMPNLEIVSCFGVGYDGVDLDYARDNNIVVTNTPDVLTNCVADLGMGLILATMRRISEGDRFVRAGRWPPEMIMDLGHSPRNKTLGIVGLGRIGMALAKLAQAFDMTVCYYNRSRREDVPFEYFDNARDLAAAVDVLALTCPGGEATRHMVDADVLAALGASGVLINVARGTVVDEAALVEALENNVIAGAGLDVFEAEPEVPAPLMAMENVVLQPHQASATVETRTAMGDLTIDNMIAYFRDGKAITPVS